MARPRKPRVAVESSSASAGPPVAAVDLFAAGVPGGEPAVIAAVPSAPAAVAPANVVTQLPRRAPVEKPGGLGAALAKPGVALTMRTAEGDESMTPFRSLDDLLSAIKPILRAAARSPDAVWFAIQPLDLASLDSDAA